MSRSQAREKEEGWRQEGHPAIKVAPKPPCMMKHILVEASILMVGGIEVEVRRHGMNVSGQT